MKIAVYAICKDEEQFVARWYKSAVNADYILLADTGSTDNTVAKYRELTQYSKKAYAMPINVLPWRFDDARNAALVRIPVDVDVCIALDLDEVLVHGWREILEKNWVPGITDRLRYNYVWSWENDKPALTYHGDKIHARKGFRWKGPVHEALFKDLRLPKETQLFIDNTLIEHHPDNSKSRSSYLPLLELAVREDPSNDRNAHYYARDLLFAQRYEEAITEFKRHLALPTATWKAERAASLRYLGDCCFALRDYDNALKWFNLCVEEDPGLREGYVALAQYHRFFKDWHYVIVNCNKALSIHERPNHYINWPVAWSDWPATMLKEAILNTEVVF